MLYIRADANSEIGSGHIMRCLAIANALKKCGEDTIFITADKEAEKLINGNGFNMICLYTSWNHLEEELSKLEIFIKNEGVKKILIDSYFVTKRYLNNLRKLTKTIYLDDLNEYNYPVDMLINYSICASQVEYEKKYSTNTRLLIGSPFIPLREEFSNLKGREKDNITDILITTGGSDSYNIAGRLIQHIRNVPRFDFLKLHVVLGAFNTNRELLAKMKEEYQNIILYHNVTQMADLMQKCDIAISAGGTTLYELCACGIPCICFSFADNQLEGAEEFNRQQLMYYVGDVRNSMESCLIKIVSRIEILDTDRTHRRELSERIMRVVDGLGANRIAEELLII